MIPYFYLSLRQINHQMRLSKTCMRGRMRPDIHEAVYCTAIEHGGSEDWDFLFEQYQASFTHFSTERQLRANGLVCSAQAWVLNR